MKSKKIPVTITKEMQQFIIDVAPTTTTGDLTEKFNKKFNKNYTRQYLYYLRAILKAPCLDTKFKKGHESLTTKPLGSEKIKHGTIFIKVRTMKEAKNYDAQWERKNRYMYKKYHGSIPDNCEVIFLNCDKTDFSKDNLIAVNKKIIRLISIMDLLPNKPCDKEVTRTAIMIAELYMKLNQIKARNKNK